MRTQTLLLTLELNPYFSIKNFTIFLIVFEADMSKLLIRENINENNNFHRDMVLLKSSVNKNYAYSPFKIKEQAGSTNSFYINFPFE